MNDKLAPASQETTLSDDVIEQAREFARAALATTRGARTNSGWADFERYCANHKYVSMPASPTTLIGYLTETAVKGQKPSTLQAKLMAISFNHSLKGLPNPAQDNGVKLLIKGIRRTKGTRPNQKAPILREDLKRMVATLDTSLRGKRDKAILLLGFAGAFRRSELVGLNVADIRFIRFDGMDITLQRSKTDQEGTNEPKHIPRIGNESIDPVRAVSEWLKAAEIT